MTKKFSRRKMVQGLGGAGLVLSTNMLSLFTSNFLNNVFATTDIERYYLSLYLSGGPARWTFDLPLAPLEQDNIEFNLTTMTRVNPITNQPEYHLVKVGDYYLPPMWGGQLATPSGSTNASDLLTNMVNIRGVRGHSSNGHQANRDLKYQLSSGDSSIHGQIADLKKPTSEDGIAYPSLSSGFMRYNSKLGTSNIWNSGAETSFLTSLLDSFNSSSDLSYRDVTEGYIDQAIATFADNLQTNNPKARTSYNDRLSAKAFFKKEFGNFIDSFNTLRSKYLTMINRQVSESSLLLGEGIDQGSFLTKSDNGIAERLYDFQNVSSNLYEDNSTIFDREGILRGSHYVPDGSTFSFENATQVDIAEKMALAEYCFSQNICRNMNLNLGSLTNVSIGGVNRTFSNDSHNYGAISHLVFYTKYYQCISACTLEFVNQLKGLNIFDKTVVEIFGDFNRSAEADGSGSDHGWTSCVSTMISGKIQEHIIMGKTTRSTSSKYRGSWGIGTNISELGNQPIHMGNVFSTRAALLEMDSLSPNTPSLLRKVGSRFVSTIGGPESD